MPVDTRPEAMSNACASSGISPNAMRPCGAQARSANQSPRGSATSAAIVAHAAAAAWRNAALAATATALQSAPWSASASTPGRKPDTEAPATSCGAKKSSADMVATWNATTDASSIVQTPRNLPST